MKKSSPSPEADALAPVYALLAELLSREIDEEMLALLRLGEVREILTGAEPGVESALESPWNRKAFEDHAVEFCRLFIHPGKCLPIAGKWTGKAEDETFSVRRWFDGGFPSSEMPKHLAELSDTNVAKILAVRAGLAEAPEDVVRDYEDEMIHPWRKAFAARLSETATFPVYRATAGVLHALG